MEVKEATKDSLFLQINGNHYLLIKDLKEYSVMFE